MNQINNSFLNSFYETFSFVMTKSFAAKKELISFYFNSWVIVDNYKQILSTKLVLKMLKKIMSKNLLNNNLKILFILDDDLTLFFFDIITRKNFYYTHNIKTALAFLQTSKLAPTLSAIIFIGKNGEIPTKTLLQSPCPVFFFIPKKKKEGGIINYNALNFQGSLFFLRTLLKEIFK